MSRHLAPLYSWGRSCPSVPEFRIKPAWTSCPLPAPGPNGSFLAWGKGRSYGDSCLNSGGTIIDTHRLDRLIHFDPSAGEIECEAGVTFASLLEFIVPRGLFLPVTPGTQHVTVGGAIANDVHGKNHHRAGTFGCHVIRLSLLRSDGSKTDCSPAENAGLFAATIGGLGLTGLILSARFRLKHITSPFLETESVAFHSPEEMMSGLDTVDRDNEYTVAWLDCATPGKKFKRGFLMLGNSLPAGSFTPPVPRSSPKLGIPTNAPGIMLNPLTAAAFNSAYTLAQHLKSGKRTTHFQPFFYPLDAVNNWNRLYGRNGFFQFQCVVPSGSGTQNLLREIERSHEISYLTVVKKFGTIASPGLLSFPRPGITLCFDFPNRGGSTRQALRRFHDIVREAGGAFYPAKDAVMSPSDFEASYPRWREILPWKDSSFSSDFWRRTAGHLG